MRKTASKRIDVCLFEACGAVVCEMAVKLLSSLQVIVKTAYSIQRSLKSVMLTRYTLCLVRDKPCMVYLLSLLFFEELENSWSPKEAVSHFLWQLLARLFEYTHFSQKIKSKITLASHYVFQNEVNSLGHIMRHSGVFSHFLSKQKSTMDPKMP